MLYAHVIAKYCCNLTFIVDDFFVCFREELYGTLRQLYGPLPLAYPLFFGPVWQSSQWHITSKIKAKGYLMDYFLFLCPEDLDKANQIEY